MGQLTFGFVGALPHQHPVNQQRQSEHIATECRFDGCGIVGRIRAGFFHRLAGIE